MDIEGDVSWHDPLVLLLKFMKIEPDLAFRLILLINPHAAATHVKGMEKFLHQWQSRDCIDWELIKTDQMGTMQLNLHDWTSLFHAFCD